MTHETPPPPPTTGLEAGPDAFAFLSSHHRALVSSFHQLVVANPLPMGLKRQLLTERFGGNARLEIILDRLGGDSQVDAMRRSAPQAIEGSDRLVVDAIFRMANPNRSGTTNLEGLRGVAGNRFDAWVGVAAFAAEASLLSAASEGSP